MWAVTNYWQRQQPPTSSKCSNTLDGLSEAVASPLLRRWTALFQRHRNVPIRDCDEKAANNILAFSERRLLAEAVEEVGYRRGLCVRY
jgi:hypothetical protein